MPEQKKKLSTIKLEDPYWFNEKKKPLPPPMSKGKDFRSFVLVSGSIFFTHVVNLCIQYTGIQRKDLVKLYTYNSQLLDLIGDEDLLYYIHNILKDKKITPDAYADIFCLIHSREAVPEEMITYDTEGDTWHRGTKVLTDARLFGLLNTVCEIITLYVNSAWEDSLFSAWTSDKPLKRAQKAMEDMESLSSLRTILSRCAETLSYGKQCPKGDDCIDWESDAEGRSPDIKEHLDEEE